MKRVRSSLNRFGLAGALVATSVLVPAVALASVKLEGTWPDSEKSISIDASGLSRSEAVRKVADAAGWSVVVHAPPGDPVDLHVKNQPATKVLELVLNDASYVAKRDGTLVDIERGEAAAADSTASAPVASVATAVVPPIPPPPAVGSATPPVPPPPPAAASAENSTTSDRGEDRTITGGHLQIEPGETAKDVTVLGGSVDVLGNVTGDLTVLGGSARVHKDAKVHGDATAIGGTLDIDDGAEVDGDVGVIGGVLNRAPGAKVHGEIVQGKSHKDKNIKIKLGDDDEDPGKSPGISLHRTMGSIGGALTRSAILFVFGAVLLALATDRMERLRAEIAARPMRSFALGLIGTLAASLAAVVLCITLIGIPIAVVGTLFAVFAGYAGFCAALATGGQALFGHRSPNPYMHLAIGCVLFMLLGSIPWIGTWITVACAFIGFGAMVATRGAGILNAKARTI